MKKISIILLMLLLGYSAAACSTEINNTDAEISTNTYRFPPDQAELEKILQMVGLDWQINPKQNADIRPQDAFAAHSLSDANSHVTCRINLQYDPDKQGSFRFTYQSMTTEAYEQFQEEEWPLFWSLCGELFLAPEAINTLSEQCMAYYHAYTAAGEDYLEWWGRQDDMACRVTFLWYPKFSCYRLDGIDFFEPIALSKRQDHYINLFQHQDQPATISDVIETQGTPVVFVVRGHIEYLQPNDDRLEDSPYRRGLPANTDFYQKGWLVDATGRLPVYIMPTPLLGNELAEERLHVVRFINGSEPYYFLQHSALNFTHSD